MKNITMVPKLRFANFSGEWEHSHLEKYCQRISVGLATSVTKYYRDVGIPIVRNLNIKDGYFDGEKMLYLCKEFAQANRGKVAKGLDVISVHTGSNIGQTCVLPAVFDNCQTFTTLITTPKKGILDPYFLSIHMNSVLGRREVARLQVGGGKGNLNTGDLKKYYISIPTIEEQQKIAGFISSVDKKISLLKEKHALLKQYKKGGMQKLFSQKVRFKDENGNDFPKWQEKVVGDFMVESRIKGSSGLTAKKITVKLWGKGVFQKNKNILGSENTQYYKRRAGQFLYSKLDFLNCAFGIIPDFLDGFETTVDLPCFDIDDDINKYLILELIKQKSFYKKYGDMADGSRKARRIHAKDFLSFPINLPCTKEQNKIASFLQAIDKKLGLVVQQIDQTQTFKKGLLQQMFV